MINPTLRTYRPGQAYQAHHLGVGVEYWLEMYQWLYKDHQRGIAAFINQHLLLLVLNMDYI